jgi:hypothetical protein
MVHQEKSVGRNGTKAVEQESKPLRFFCKPLDYFSNPLVCFRKPMVYLSK